jgi:hypothetical protein
MGWRGTIALLAVVLIAGTYLLLAAPPEAEVSPNAPTLLGEPRLTDPSRFVALLPFQPAEVVTIRIRHGDRELTTRRSADHWRGVSKDAPIDAFLQAMTELGRVMEIPASPDALADYGLDAPGSTVELTLTGGSPPLSVQVGDQNPAGTGVYVRVDGEKTIVLAGALMTWELDKLFRLLAD